jgi:transcriptional regulator with XRE-family HTH domain
VRPTRQPARKTRANGQVPDLMAKLRDEQIRVRLRQARDETGMSRAVFGDVLQVHPASIEAWESGARGVPYGMINAWAEATGKSVEWLMHGHEPVEIPQADQLERIERVLLEIRDLLVAVTAPEEARDEWVAEVRSEIQRQETTERNGHADPEDPPNDARHASGA